MNLKFQVYFDDKKKETDTMICLGIEGTAHSFGVGIIQEEADQVDILSNVRSVYTPEGGGIHPREAAQHLGKVIKDVIKKAIETADIRLSDIDLVAFAQGPGLGPCLRTSATGARALSLLIDAPLVGVNHCVAHAEIGKLITDAEDPVILYVSGANTIVSALEGRRYRVFGETLDIAIGNMLDTFAREVGLQHPGGPKIEKLAKKGKKLIDLPYIVKGMDLSFSGLLTAAIKQIKDTPVEDLCFSLQEVAFSMLTEVTERALAHTEKPDVLLTGGVSPNRRLQEMLKYISEEHDAKFYAVASPALAGDNGAMIAWTGILAYKSGQILEVEKSYVIPHWRMDQVEITWVPDE